MQKGKHKKPRSLEHRKKISEFNKGSRNGMFGKKNPYLTALNKSRVGKLNNMFGKHLSEETKEKLRKIMKTKPGPWLGKKRINFTGDKTPMWKGGITPENVKIRTSPQYNVWRRAVFARDGYTCQDCDFHGGYLHAHHVKSFAKFPELRFEVSNGVTLCVDCHKKRHEKIRTKSTDTI